MVVCSCSFLLTMQLLQHVRGRCTNKVKRPVQELGGQRGEGIFSKGAYFQEDCTCSCAETPLRGSKCIYCHVREFNI